MRVSGPCAEAIFLTNVRLKGGIVLTALLVGRIRRD